MVFIYFALHNSFKRPFFVGKNSNLFYFLRSCFMKPCKSVFLFRNNATRFLYKIQRRKFVLFSHTWSIRRTVKLHRKSGLTFIGERGWVYEKRRSDIFHSKIDLRDTPKIKLQLSNCIIIIVCNVFNPLMHNVLKWSDTLQKSCSICCKIFKVCLTILRRYALRG